MTGTVPPGNFHAAKLEITTVRSGQKFGRIYHGFYPDPLGYGKTASRFSDPRRRKPENRFGVLYLGETTKVCFLEAVLRDQRDGRIDEILIPETDLTNRRYAEIELRKDLNLVDLRDDSAIRMGVPTDVAKASKQTLSRLWSLAIHDHPDAPDGIIYSSRLNGTTNIAVYDRAVGKLGVARVMPLIGAPGLAAVLDDLRVGLIGSP